MKKVIWITGGSSGIGKAVALKFANKGWQVIISSRREEVLKDISDNNENIDYLKLDIVDYEACHSVFKKIVEKIAMKLLTITPLHSMVCLILVKLLKVLF